MRLIDADKLIHELEGLTWYHINKKGELVKGANSSEMTPLYKAEDIYMYIDNAPTIYPICEDKACKYRANERPQGDLISREALRKKLDEVQYTREFCVEHQIDYSISMQMLGMVIDNAPTVEKTILKRRDVNKCLNCSYCCEASINSGGEVYIMCNLGSQCLTKEDKEC